MKSSVSAAPISLRNSSSPSPSTTTTFHLSYRRNPVNDLPTELLLLIAQYTVPQKGLPKPRSEKPSSQPLRSTNDALLGYSLVQKSWKPILKILYSSIGHENPISQPKLFAYSLQMQPEVRDCLTHFVPDRRIEHPAKWECFIHPNTETNTAWSTILRLSAGSIAHISMAFELLYPLRDSLCQLRSVETCVLNQRYQYEEMLTDGTDIFVILFPTICHWSRLSQLSIHVWYWQRELDSDHLLSMSSQLLEYQPPAFSLNTLSLSAGPYSGPQLLHLLSSSTHTLEMLTLQHISGLSKVDLYNIISGPWCHVLKLLRIEGNYSPNSPELATNPSLNISGCTPIDMAISQMVNLTCLLIDDNLVTPYVIASKPHHSPGLSDKPLPSIGIQPTAGETEWSAEDILSALRTTGWKSIHIIASFAADDEVAEKVREAANERGITTYIIPANTLS